MSSQSHPSPYETPVTTEESTAQHDYQQIELDPYDTILPSASPGLFEFNPYDTISSSTLPAQENSLSVRDKQISGC